MLGEDPTGVAYIGLDANQGFSPLNIAGFEAHSMVAPHEVPFPGYMDRLKTLMNTTTSFPIRANGFADHTLCSQSSECMSGRCGKETMWSENHCIGIECIQDDDCPSDRCEHGTCLVKLGSCMSCDEDSDCTGGKCLLFKCSGANSLMDDECICKWDSDCASGRCELLEAGVCEAQLAVGAKCNENSDCKSNLCGWSFRCNELSAQGAFCWKNSECLSGKCNWHFQCEGRGESATSTATVAESMAISEQTAASSVHTLFGGRLVLVVACIGVAMKYVVPAYHRQKNGYAEIVATEMSV